MNGMSSGGTVAENPFIADVLKGWEAYQQLLLDAVGPLTEDQLALRAGQDLRPAGMIAAHIVSARVSWLRQALQEGGEELDRWAEWDLEGEPIPGRDELIHALEESWQPIKAGLERWEAGDYAQTYTEEKENWTFTRAWVIWHLMEHDLHHGGELSLLLGSHGLRGVEIT